MRHTFVFIAAVLISTAAVAQQPMSSDEIKSLINGKQFTVGSDGFATYKADGSYEYTVSSDLRTFRGKWSVQGDRVCVQFDNGTSRCDQYLKDGTKIVLKNSQGRTFTVTAK